MRKQLYVTMEILLVCLKHVYALGANKQLSFYLWTSQTSRIPCPHAVTPNVWKQLLLFCTILNRNRPHLDAGAMSKEGLGALRVVQGSVAHTPPRSPDGEFPTVKQVPWAVAVLSGFIHDLQRDQNNSSSTTHAELYLKILFDAHKWSLGLSLFCPFLLFSSNILTTILNVSWAMSGFFQSLMLEPHHKDVPNFPTLKPLGRCYSIFLVLLHHFKWGCRQMETVQGSTPPWTHSCSVFG